MQKKMGAEQDRYFRQRAIQYQHVDGTFELTFGGSFLLMAASFYAISRVATADSFFSSNILPFAPLLVFAGGSYLLDVLVKRFRLRVTYPRTGFIVYQKPKPFKRSIRLAIWIGVPVLTLIVMGMLFLNRAAFHSENQDITEFLLAPFAGLLFYGLWIIVGWKIALPRFYFIAVGTLLVSTWLLFNKLGGNDGMAALIGAMGLMLCISGGLALWIYLANNPLPQEPGDGE